MPPKKRGQRPPPRKSSPGRPAAARTSPARAAGSERSAAGARSFYTPGGSPFRHRVERRSAPLLVLMTQAPRLVIMLTPLALLLLGLFLPLIGGLIALGAFFVLTGWLAYLSWPNADGRAKFIRLLMFALVIGLVVVRVVRA